MISAKPRCKINVLKSVLVIFDKEVKHKQDVRNQLVFEGKSIPEEEILTKAITLAKEWTSCQEKIPPPSCKTPSCTQPAPNCSVLNTDAAWKASNLTAGLGWTIKTQEETAEFTKPCRFVDCFDCRRVGSARSTSTMQRIGAQEDPM